MSTTPSDPLEALREGTPELGALADSVGLTPWVGAATVAVARKLAGQPVRDAGPLGALWLAVAEAELRLLETACGRDPLRAAAAAVAWTAEVLRHVGATTRRKSSARPRADDPKSDRREASLRAQLEVLMGRRVPKDFPLPTPPAAQGGVFDAADVVREEMAVVKAGSAGVAAVCACDEAVLALSTLVPGLSWDFSTRALHQTLLFDLKRLSALLGRLEVLRRIADELGRIESFERRTRRMDGGGRETVVGVRVGGELSDALACELALLADPDTEDLFFQRFVEHRLICLEMVGSVTETTRVDGMRGPAIACVDTSGSMAGAPEAVAKALMLAVVRKLVPQGRAVQLLSFGGPGEATRLEIRRGREGLENLIDFLCMGFHAGTDYDTPLLRALDLLRTSSYERADVLIVTDGLCRASQKVVDEVATEKRRSGARILSIVVGGDMAGVDAFSDRVWLVDPAAQVEGGIDLREWQPI